MLTPDEQEMIFVREVEKRIDQLTVELDIGAFFVLGFLDRLKYKIHQEMDLDAIEDQLREDNTDDEKEN